MPQIKCAVCGKTCKVRANQKTCGMECGKKYRTRHVNDDLDLGEQQVKTDDKWEINTLNGRIKSLKDLIRECSVDLETWDIERHVINKWEVGAVHPKTGNILTEPLFQVKAWLKKRHQIIAIRDEITAMKEAAKNWSPKSRSKPKPSKSGIMAEIAIMDHHIMGLSWSQETGWDDWDLQKALQCYEEAFLDIITRTSSFDPERIIIVVGNDLLHTDNRSGTTEKGTPQDVDSRYQKGFKRVRELHVDLINRAIQIADTHVYMIPGNHDMLGTWQLGDSLECWFRNNKHVTIRNEPTPRKYCLWGEEVLIGLDHGKHLKRGGDNMALVMAAEMPGEFKRKHKEMHVGHTHQLKVREVNGVRIRVLPSLTPPNAWSSELGFVGNMRSSEGFLWHGKDGLVGTVIHSKPPRSVHEHMA